MNATPLRCDIFVLQLNIFHGFINFSQVVKTKVYKILTVCLSLFLFTSLLVEVVLQNPIRIVNIQAYMCINVQQLLFMNNSLHPAPAAFFGWGSEGWLWRQIHSTDLPTYPLYLCVWLCFWTWSRRGGNASRDLDHFYLRCLLPRALGRDLHWVVWLHTVHVDRLVRRRAANLKTFDNLKSIGQLMLTLH